MKEKQDYIRDLAEMRSMMERSSKFLSLSGLAGIMAGIYALTGAFIAYRVFDFDPGATAFTNATRENLPSELMNVILLATAILVLAIGTALFLSYKKAGKRGERLWNATSRRVLVHMAVPLVAGGILILILISKGFIGLMAPLTLLFYGFALFNASKYTYEEMRSLGMIQIVLGLIGSYFTGYGLLFWALGFGVAHIVYGIYLHYKYER